VSRHPESSQAGREVIGDVLRTLEASTDEDCPGETGLLEIGVAEIGRTQVGAFENCFCQGRAVKDSALGDRSPERRPSEVCLVEIGTGEVHRFAEATPR
jgi:hypothetical protein